MITAATGWEPGGALVSRWSGTHRWTDVMVRDVTAFIGRPPTTVRFEERRAPIDGCPHPIAWYRLAFTWREEGTLKG